MPSRFRFEQPHIVEHEIAPVRASALMGTAGLEFSIDASAKDPRSGHPLFAHRIGLPSIE
jgi:hypothetical protein